MTPTHVLFAPLYGWLPYLAASPTLPFGGRWELPWPQQPMSGHHGAYSIMLEREA